MKKIVKDKKELIPYENSKALSEFLNNPQVKIAELVTGALALGRPEAILIGGRLIQGALKGNLMKQIGRELNYLNEKGKIKEDYADQKYGFQSLSELLSFIDNEAPDKDKFEAVKALFYSIIDKDTPEGSEMFRYQLFQICKRLKSSQLLTLKATYNIRDINISNADQWAKEISKSIGHNSQSLVENDEKALLEENLIDKRLYSDESGVGFKKGRGRLTDLGIALAEMILYYENFENKSTKG